MEEKTTRYFGEIIIPPPTITFLNVMRLHSDGSVEFLKGAAPNDAAIAFLKAVNQMAPSFLQPSQTQKAPST